MPPPSATATPTESGSSAAGSPFGIMPALPPLDFEADISCSGLIGPADPVAIVQLRGSDDLVLRDYADVAHPRTACTFGWTPGQQGSQPLEILDARHIVIVWGGRELWYAVVGLPEVRYRWFALPDLPQTPDLSWPPEFVAVSPNLDQVLWVSHSADDLTSGYGTTEVHVTTASGDRTVVSHADLLPGFCGASPSWGMYTRTGEHALVRTGEGGSQFTHLFVLEGETPVLSIQPPDGGWSMGSWPGAAIWSPTSETLYYTQGGDVWRWAPGADPVIYLPGVSWLSATMTPDGTHLAYEVQNPDDSHSVYLVDLAGDGAPHQIGKGPRIRPRFVNNTQLWYETGSSGGCVPGPEEPQPLIYNLADGSESPSILDSVWNVWPGT